MESLILHLAAGLVKIPEECSRDELRNAGPMSDADAAAIHYLKLATISRAKQQLAGCDRFLVLAGAAAYRAGWLDVAEECRTRVLRHNSHHLLRRWETLPDALRSDEFPPFFRQLERFCPVERAESLLSELNETIEFRDNVSRHDQALEQLADAAWDE